MQKYRQQLKGQRKREETEREKREAGERKRKRGGGRNREGKRQEKGETYVLNVCKIFFLLLDTLKTKLI